MEHASLPPLPTLVNFGVLAVGIVFLARKPFLGALQSRHDQWKKDIGDAEALRVETETVLKTTEGRVAALQAEVAKIFEDAREAAEREKSEILAQAERQAQKIVEDAQRLAEAERANAQKGLRRELFTEALAKARADLKAGVGAAEHQLFVDRFSAERKNG